MSIVKLCVKCKKIVIYPNRYCESCSKLYKEEQIENNLLSNKRYNKKRDRKYINFYKSIEWGILKEKRLQDTDYYCERCKSQGRKRLATEVHHIKPIQTEEGWMLRLVYINTMSVCLECHNYYHNRFKKGGNKNETETNCSR